MATFVISDNFPQIGEMLEFVNIYNIFNANRSISIKLVSYIYTFKSNKQQRHTHSAAWNLRCVVGDPDVI